MWCLCLWHVAKSRGTEDLGEGVSMRQGEWRDAIEGGSLAFPFVNMKVSVFCKNFSQHCTLWKPQVCKVS